MDAQNLARRFPPDFRFGVATAAYQIEGAARKDGRGPSIWDAFSHMPGRVVGGDTGDVACDHYHRWEADLDLIAGLGVDAYRFSIAWPRIFPQGRGAVNEAGLAFYDRLVDGMLARGLAPFATLYHWDLPLALAGYGGWTDRDTASAFADYAALIARRLGDRVETIATFNEPWCVTHMGHLYGKHAPGEASVAATMKAAHVLNLAHGHAIQAMRAEAPKPALGVVINALSAYPASDAPADVAATRRHFAFHNDIFFGPMVAGAYDPALLEAYGDLLDLRDGDLAITQQPLDWWGFNYYNPFAIADAPGTPFPAAREVPVTDSDLRTDIGWEIKAEGLGHLLRQVYDRYDLPPVYVTENGAAYNMGPDAAGVIDDQPRIDYLAAHLSEAADCVEAGVPLRGYFAWSLMDNFEWAEGYAMRFGLVHVDYQTQIRTPKRSAEWYRALLAARPGASV